MKKEALISILGLASIVVGTMLPIVFGLASHDFIWITFLIVMSGIILGIQIPYFLLVVSAICIIGGPTVLLITHLTTVLSEPALHLVKFFTIGLCWISAVFFATTLLQSAAWRVFASLSDSIDNFLNNDAKKLYLTHLLREIFFVYFIVVLAAYFYHGVQFQQSTYPYPSIMVMIGLVTMMIFFCILGWLCLALVCMILISFFKTIGKEEIASHLGYVLCLDREYHIYSLPVILTFGTLIVMVA